jgi:nucleotide-binding universal stress UspA family protein
MFRKILVPLDGSPFAERALPLAQSLAEANDADLELVRIVPATGPAREELGLVSYMDEHRIKTAEAYLARPLLVLSEGRAVLAEVKLAPDAATGIINRAVEIGADLILMTSHGESWPDVNRIGGTASRLIREAPCPLLVVGPQASEDTGAAEDRAAVWRQGLAEKQDTGGQIARP